MLKFGHFTEEELYRRVRNKKQKIKDRVLNSRPSLDQKQQVAWNSFCHLHRARLEGFSGPQRIQVSEIIVYSRCQIMYEEDELVEIILGMDDLYFEWYKQQG